MKCGRNGFSPLVQISQAASESVECVYRHHVVAFSVWWSWTLPLQILPVTGRSGAETSVKSL